MRSIEIIIAVVFFTAILCLFPRVANAQRVKDLANVRGVRPIHLTGIGLVIGLNGTGDSQRNEVFKQYYVQALANMGTGIAPEVTDVKTRNAAVVMVNATVPSSMKPGTEFEVTVSSVGDAESLRDGFLLASPMKLPYADESPGEWTVYAQAHGVVYSEAEGADKFTKGKSRSVLVTVLDENPFLSNLENVTLVLDKPNFGTSSEIAAKINAFDLFRDAGAGALRHRIARPLDSSTVRVRIPTSYLRANRIIDFISELLEIEVADVEREALVAIDRQRGSVVVNGSVLVSLPAFITYKGARIRIPASGTADGGPSEGGELLAFGPAQRPLVDVISALESPELGFTGVDVIHILEQMSMVGLIKGKFVER